MDFSKKVDSGNFSDYLKNIPIPEELPFISKELKGKIELLAKDDIENLSFLIKNIELNWLMPEDTRLGVTIFSGDHNELYRKKRLNLPLGHIKINLHPVLVDDKKLYEHTLVHEILHASGMIEHSKKHDDLTNKIAPAPSLSESVVLRYLQAVMISKTNVLSWECIFCNHIWTRNTILKPKKCPKCLSLIR